MILDKQEVREEGENMKSREVEPGVICKVEVDIKFAKNVANGEELGEQDLLNMVEQQHGEGKVDDGRSEGKQAGFNQRSGADRATSGITTSKQFNLFFLSYF